MKPPSSTNVWLLFCRLSGGIVMPSLWTGFAVACISLQRSAIACIGRHPDTLSLQDSTSNGPCKGGVSVIELMYCLIYFCVFFIIRAGIANDDYFGV